MCGPRAVARGRCAGHGEAVNKMVDRQLRRGLFGRRRRENVPGGRRVRHEVKVTPEEEGRLAKLAAEQHVTIPRLLVESTLAGAGGETATERNQLLRELMRVHRDLGAIGNNINQMAKATNISGEIHPGLADMLHRLREQLRRVADVIDRV